MLTMSNISKCKKKPGSCFIHVTDIISGRPWTCQPRSGNIASCYIKSLYIFFYEKCELSFKAKWYKVTLKRK